MEYIDPFANEEQAIEKVISKVPETLSAGFTIVGEAANDAKLDTSKYESERANALKFIPNIADYDTLIESYYSTPYLEPLNKRDISLTRGQKWASVGKGIMSGASAGVGIGSTLGWWGPGAGVGAGIGAAIGGVFGGISKGIGLGVRNHRENKFLKEENPRRELINIRNQNAVAAVTNSTRAKLASNSLINQAAYGGPLFNLSENFDNGIIFINTGGSHETNPFGGVMVGMDKNGIPNLVEEGEVIWNDYVFSNRLKPTKAQLKENNLSSKYEGWTFAKIVEELQNNSSERPNDYIASNSLKDTMNTIINMQEQIRSTKAKKSNVYDTGGFMDITRFGNKELPINYFNNNNESLSSDTKNYSTFTFKLSEDVDIANSEADALLDMFNKVGIDVKIYSGDNTDNNAITLAVAKPQIPEFVDVLEDENTIEKNPYFSKGAGKAYKEAFEKITSASNTRKDKQERFDRIKEELNKEIQTQQLEDTSLDKLDNVKKDINSKQAETLKPEKTKDIKSYRDDLNKYLGIKENEKLINPVQETSKSVEAPNINTDVIVEEPSIEIEDNFELLPKEEVPLMELYKENIVEEPLIVNEEIPTTEEIYTIPPLPVEEEILIEDPIIELEEESFVPLEINYDIPYMGREEKIIKPIDSSNISKKAVQSKETGKPLTNTERVKKGYRGGESTYSITPQGFSSMGSSLRYSPLLANSFAYMMNAFSDPDYRNAERIERASRGITRGSYTPYGNYINIPGVNRQSYLNPYLASSRSNIRAIQNQGLNAGQTIAGLISNEYNTQKNIGPLMSSIEDMDLNRRLQQETFNRGTRQLSNADSLRALSATQAAEQLAYQGILQGAQLRDAENRARDMALSSNLDNITESLAGIGSENYWGNVIRTSPHLRYYTDAYGRTVYKGSNGGYLTRKRRNK